MGWLDCIRDYGDSLDWDAAPLNFFAHTLAKRNDAIGAPQYISLQLPYGAITQTIDARASEIDRSILPESTYLINERKFCTPGGAEGRNAVKYRRMRMQD